MKFVGCGLMGNVEFLLMSLNVEWGMGMVVEASLRSGFRMIELRRGYGGRFAAAPWGDADWRGSLYRAGNCGGLLLRGLRVG